MKKILFFIAVCFFSLNLKAIETENLYVVGDAMPCLWANWAPEVMFNLGDGNFTWTGKVTAGSFKLLFALNDWGSSLNATTSDEAIIFGSEHNLIEDERGGDYKFIIKPADAGIVTITVNAPAMKMVVTKKEDVFIPTDLWITGSAVPNGVAQLTHDLLEGDFRYDDELLVGEFKLMSTPEVGDDTKYFVPVLEEADVIGFTQMLLTEDKELAGWKVNVANKTYQLNINTIGESLLGEIYTPRSDLFIVGGATEAGWNSGASIALIQDLDNPYVFVFEGVLKIADDGNDRNMFKFLGQKSFNPVSFHPLTQGEPVLESEHIYEGLAGDHKWTIDADKQGNYKIVINLKEETFSATFLGSGGSSIKDNEVASKYTVTSENRKVNVYSKENLNIDYARLLDVNGREIAFAKTPASNFTIGNNLAQGVYVLMLSIDNKTTVTKVLIK